MQRTLPNAWANTVYMRYITYCTVIHTVRHWYLMYEIEGITNWVLKATKNIETEIFSAVRQLNMQKVVRFLSVSITQLQFSVSSHAGLWTKLPCIVLKTIWINRIKTDPVSVGTDETEYVRLLFTISRFRLFLGQCITVLNI